MNIHYILVIVFLVGGGILSVLTAKLTVGGGITGMATGFLIYAGASLNGLAILAAFFIIGSAATSWKFRAKQASGLAEENKGRRTAGQVIANGGVAAILGLAAWSYPEYQTVLRLMIAASFASAMADTLSSELGNYYGRKFYNIITLRPDIKGLNGVVSMEGTLIGIAGSIFIGVIYSIGNGWHLHMLWIIVAGTIGNLTDSILGATVERKHILNNNAVNFLNTFIAAIVGALFYILF